MDSLGSIRQGREIDRRRLLQVAGGGFGALALRSLLDREGRLIHTTTASEPTNVAEPRRKTSEVNSPVVGDRGGNPLRPRAPHFAPRAKAVIFLFMYGGPSHVDLFDPKPELVKRHGQPIPVFRAEDAFMVGKTKNAAFGSPYRFQRCGESGLEVAEVYPELGKRADQLCVIRSMHCASNNHGPAIFQMNSGFLQAGHPCLGSWTTYGLGSEADNLPAFVVMLDHQGAPVNGALNWSNGFMPATYQGVPFRVGSEPVAYLRPPKQVTTDRQQARLQLLQRWNAQQAAAHEEAGSPAASSLAARIASYELAFRMQSGAAECVDLSSETAATRRSYGLDDKTTAHFGRNCLLARRLVERGVRFVQIYSGGNEGPRAWDAHDDLKKNHDLHCAETDRPIAALLDDLKQRGLLDSTLVVWGGEFGRSPVAENGKGRDHHPHGFTMWLAGAGVRPGMVLGQTDEFGYHAIEDRVAVPDLHATMLHLLGFDHERLTYEHNGRNYRLTDVAGRVVREILT